MGEVNEITDPEEEDGKQVMPSSEIPSSKKNSSHEKPKKMEESLIEF